MKHTTAPYYKQNDAEMSAGFPTGESTIATRHDIGLTPRRKSGGPGGGGGTFQQHLLQQKQHLQPPKAISIRSPQHSPDSSSSSSTSRSSSEESKSNFDLGGVEDGFVGHSSSSSTTTPYHHHQYKHYRELSDNHAGRSTSSMPSLASSTTETTAHHKTKPAGVVKKQNVTTTTKTVTTTAKSQKTFQSTSTSTPKSVALDLKRNDNAFYVIATLIVDRFSDRLHCSGSNDQGIVVSATDRDHLDRVVPRKYDFIHALQWRLVNKLQEHSLQPINVITRKCRALGLHREGNQNPLLATIGSLILINSDEATVVSNLASIQGARPHGSDELARQQLLAELREASTLMAESVTPEASQFWRKHVIELQAKLRSLQKVIAEDIPSPVQKNSKEAANVLKSNEELMATLWQNTGYVPPSQDEMTAVSNSVTAESRGPSISQSNVNISDPRDMDFPMIDVVAPADLPAGYQFEAAIDNTIFMATVPMGGVKKGQTFSCYMKDIKQAGIPYGHWKDGFFDVFKFGFKHPMVLNSFFCPLLALGQVMARVGLDYTGQQLDADARRQSGWSARGMMACVIFFWLGLNSLIVYGFELKLHHFLYLSAADIFSLVIVNATFIFFTIYSTIKTRAFLQEKFQIDRQSTEAQLRRENVILSTLCLPLTIAQMGRHTASYDRYEGVCCNENGIPKEENNDVSTGVV